MKFICSAAALLALASTLVSAAPLAGKRSTISISANELWVITNPAPATIIQAGPNNQLADVSINNGNNEIDTIVSFSLGGNPAPSSTSTCRFVIQNVSPSGSGIVQL